MRKKIVAGNWKMNLSKTEGLTLVSDVVDGLNGKQGCTVIIAPPFPFVSEAITKTKDSQVSISAQNCHHESSGAFTGEVSASTLASFGCDYCIVGHSERRAYCSEDDAQINQKVVQLLANGIRPIFCCGESLEQRESEKHFEVVGAQIQAGLQGLKSDELLKVVVAYEPIWAIGTGETATPAQAQEMHAFIREKLGQVLQEKAEELSIVYGGSVKPNNAKELFAQKDIDGALVGGASLKATDFLQIINSF